MSQPTRFALLLSMMALTVGLILEGLWLLLFVVAAIGSFGWISGRRGWESVWLFFAVGACRLEWHPVFTSTAGVWFEPRNLGLGRVRSIAAIRGRRVRTRGSQEQPLSQLSASAGIRKPTGSNCEWNPATTQFCRCGAAYLVGGCWNCGVGRDGALRL